jgi:hypothetical protein
MAVASALLAVSFFERLHAAAIAFSTECVSAGTHSISATWDLAADVNSSAAMIATISWPLANQAVNLTLRPAVSFGAVLRRNLK